MAITARLVQARPAAAGYAGAVHLGLIAVVVSEYDPAIAQAAMVGKQAAGRVGFFLQVEDFDAAYARMTSAGVQFLTTPRAEPYGRVAVFADIAGHKWDLSGPAP